MATLDELKAGYEPFNDWCPAPPPLDWHVAIRARMPSGERVPYQMRPPSVKQDGRSLYALFVNETDTPLVIYDVDLVIGIEDSFDPCVVRVTLNRIPLLPIAPSGTVSINFKLPFDMQLVPEDAE